MWKVESETPFQDQATVQLNESDRKEIEMLRLLSEYNNPVGSTILRRELMKRGFLLSERTIRYHLQLLESKGFVQGHDKSGRTITSEGLTELGRAMVYQRLGFVTTRFLSMAYEVTYRPETDEGKMVANVSILDRSLRDDALEVLHSLHKSGLLPAPYFKILDEGEEYQEISVPEEKIALFTVCNLTIDGILMRSGIPVIFQCCGLVQMLNHRPVRFVEVMSYEGTTTPPLEVFVYKNMTSILSVLRTGSGMLPATLREIPARALEKAEEIITCLKRKRWGGILLFGRPNEAVLGIPVSMDRLGLSMVGGLVPGAAMREMGAGVETFAPHCLISVEDMTPI